jgi:hypothetical protein
MMTVAVPDFKFCSESIWTERVSKRLKSYAFVPSGSIVDGVSAISFSSFKTYFDFIKNIVLLCNSGILS